MITVSVSFIHGRLKIMLRVLTVSCLFLASTSAAEAFAQSLGHYHLPCTVPQYTGHGFGAGHHAPMIRPTNCHPPRQPRYVRVPGCGACGALPMESFPTSSGAGCHSQLDRLLQDGEYGVAPVTPTRATPQAEFEELTPENLQIPMLPEP